MNLLILPVSGGAFVSQLYIVSQLCKYNFKPDVILSSSGGNVVAYLACAANWDFYRLCLLSRNINKEFFYSYWNNILSVNFLIGYFKGQLFNKGNGVKEFFNNYFNEENIKKYEIWTEAYNETKKKTRLFCNKNKHECVLNLSKKTIQIQKAMEPYFADGNISEICDYSIASASIPTIVPAQEFEKDLYVDGGVSSPSPVHLLQNSIIEHILETNKNLHIFYINIMNIEKNNDDLNTGENLIFNYKNLIENIFTNQKIVDRVFTIQILKKMSNEKLDEIVFPFNKQNMKKYFQLKNEMKYSFLEIYPENKQSVNLLNFTTEDISKIVELLKNNCYCKFIFFKSYSLLVSEHFPK
jgi:predicted acylesterase/phospholipase RssA